MKYVSRSTTFLALLALLPAHLSWSDSAVADGVKFDALESGFNMTKRV